MRRRIKCLRSTIKATGTKIGKRGFKNHKKYLERRALYNSFGYDVDKERKFILKQVKPVDGRILEAGTGKGHFALELARAGYHFTTFDISVEEQAIAKLNLAYFGLDKQVNFLIEDGEHTGFADQSFDIVFSVNTLHHLHHPYQVVDEFIRILSSGGKLVLSDFTEDGFKVMDKIHGLEGSMHEVGKVDLSDIEKHLVKKGFLVKKSRSTHQRVLVAQRDV
ncbi:MAG: class I SAM-dependent methyltransferase [Candidatus Omnitrophica bacterium]|nr:class I SAM-dependent methyltransferase [Candidatus Omnitrophota bacterium]